ncbi:DM13 domain-containing protein [Flavobacterium restrictum]|uniref:DM13 domain-containing protein n=1 Tax=Flavobacterium restrictum TaxID=2594428 RepID=A0A553E4R7_9FLAO|nr:DM13 domain-containing protein [Flavobacterium restrictum]TRX40017.1 DM13 domain-containing protein [Flavobacterium restrictum]
MKTNFLLLPLLALFCSCEVECNLTKDPMKIIVDPITMPTVIEGQFQPTSGITVSGTAKVVQDGTSFKVVLDNFNISSGPDLKVYLSKTNSPSDFVNLGNLTTSKVYAIPANVAVSNYKYVLIHCQQYNHLFAVAELK